MEENKIYETAKKKFDYFKKEEESFGEKGIFIGLISNLCEHQFKGHLWKEYAEYLSEIGDHEKAKKIYKDELKNKEGLEKELLIIAKADSSKENELISFYEDGEMWENLVEFYHDTNRHDKAAEISQKYLKNRPKEVEQLLFHAKELCKKGDHLRAMHIYRDLSKYVEEAHEWNCLGKPGTAIEVLADYEYLNEGVCKKEEAGYWKQIGWFHNAADAIGKFDNLAARGLRGYEMSKEREIDAIVNNRLEKRMEGLIAEEKSKKMMIMQSNKDDISERLKIYQEKEQIWIAKIAECHLRLEEEKKARKIMEEIGLTLKHLINYTIKHKEFGKENINIRITKNAYEF